MAGFVPRFVFPALESLPRSYFLGHHRAGLNKMKTMLHSIDLVIECRDYRLPLTSRNPLFEENLSGRERLIVYTKQDLGSEGKPSDRIRESIIREFHHPTAVLFSSHKDKHSTRLILSHAQTLASHKNPLTGTRLMVVGMPNVGKSSLLNALRHLGVQKGKAAPTGAQPGVTRKIGTTVKIIAGDADGAAGVYLVDTPGVFVPYVPDAEAMLKLALCGSVKDTVIPPAILADYLLYRLNLRDWGAYGEYSGPTNDVDEFLAGVARRTGRLRRGGGLDGEASALWVVQRWRSGGLGRFLLDEISKEGMERERRDTEGRGGSVSQAKKKSKEEQRQRGKRVAVDAG